MAGNFKGWDSYQPEKKDAAKPAQTPLQRMQVLGRLPAGKMNNLEREYSRHLETRKEKGEVLWFAFEAFNLRLAGATFYKVDFAVILSDGHLQFHECKGYWTSTARVKTKVAAEKFPFQFVGVQKKKGGYVYEIF